MADLTVDDVEAFTGGRLSSADDEVQRMLDAALATSRRYSGWHVCPVREADEIVLDGPDSRILYLPTRKLVELTSIEENGVDQALATLTWSAGGPPGLLESPVRVRKRTRGWWSGDYQAITVIMDHGYTEDEAVDWRFGVLSLVSQMGTYLSSGRSDIDLIQKRIDDVSYSWTNPYTAMAQDMIGSMGAIFDDFVLPSAEVL